MAFSKKVWADRVTEYPARRTLTKTDGSTEIVNVTRNEGNVLTDGDSFSAGNMNNLEQRIYEAFGGMSIIKLTEAQYGALSEKDSTVAYFVL